MCAAFVSNRPQRSGDRRVRRRDRGLLDELIDQSRGLLGPPLGRVEQNEILVRLRIAREMLDLIAEGLLRFRLASQTSESIAANEVKILDSTSLASGEKRNGAVAIGQSRRGVVPIQLDAGQREQRENAVSGLQRQMRFAFGVGNVAPSERNAGQEIVGQPRLGIERQLRVLLRFVESMALQR